MNEQLILRLGNTPDDPVFWLIWSSADNEIIASGELADTQAISTLQDRVGERPVTCLVPGSELLLKWVELPPKAGRKALAAIPYMLEDELTGDIDELFFALGPRKQDRQAVAIVAREKIQQWQDILQQAQLNCERILPDILAMPENENGWSLLELGRQWLVRQDEWSGLQGEPEWLPQAINHYAKQQSQPLPLQVLTDIELPSLINVEVQQLPAELPMLVLAKGALQSHFNLLQGEFRPRKKKTQGPKPFLLAASLAAVALVVNLLDKGIELQQLSSTNQTLTEQIHSEYRRAFPESTRIVNVRSQMKQKLAALQQGGGEASILTMLSQLKDAFEQSRIRPENLRFDSGRAELRLQAVADNFEALETFKRMAEARGFNVQQGAINNQDSQVLGTLTIRS